MVKTELLNFSFDYVNSNEEFHNVSDNIINYFTEVLTKYNNIRYVKTVVGDDGSGTRTGKKYGLFSVNGSENYFLTIFVESQFNNARFIVKIGVTTEEKANNSTLIFVNDGFYTDHHTTNTNVYVSNKPVYIVSDTNNNICFLSLLTNGNSGMYFDIDIYTEKPIFIYRTTTIQALFDGIVTDSYQVQYTNLSISKSDVCMTENIVFNKDTSIAICKNLKIILLPVSDYQGIFECEVDGVDYVRVGNILISM